METKIKTVGDLKRHVENANSKTYFFTRETMKYFGDTMRNYGVRKTEVFSLRGEKKPVWELFRRRPVKHGLQNSAYFDAETFAQVFTKDK